METERGDAEELYRELRRMAELFMRRERAGHTLQPTALANEVFLSVGASPEGWESAAHYFGAAAQAMRRVLIQHARARRAQKRGGEAQRVTLEEFRIPAQQPGLDMLDLHEALEALANHDPSLIRLVEMRYFAGCSLDEIASMTGQSLASVKRDWSYARAWLRQYLTR